MHIFFTILLMTLLAVSIVLSNLMASVACSLLFILLITTRLLSNRIVRRSFKQLTPLKSTVFAGHSKKINEIFSGENSKPLVYVAENLDSVQFYAFGDQSKFYFVLSPKLLEHVSEEDLENLFKQGHSLSKNSRFIAKKNSIVLFLLLCSFGRYLDTALSFFLGIKTKKGEPKALTRKLIYTITDLMKTKPKFESLNAYSLKNYSYLKFNHDQPVLSPLSIADMNLG